MTPTLQDLTPNGIATIIGMTSSSQNPSFRPTFQVLNVKKLGEDKWRTVLSDGTHFVHGMVASQMNSMIHDGSITKNSVLKIHDFMNNTIQTKNVIIMLNVEVIGVAPDKLGDPTDIERAGASSHIPASNAAPSVTPMYGGPNTNDENNPYASPNKKQKGDPYGTPSLNGRGGAPVVVHNNNTPGGTPITPISQLNMHQNKWTIKARIVSKSDIRTWSNAKGEGSLFSIELLDSSGMDIRAALFKEAVDKFYNFLQVGSVYTISGGRIKVASIQWNTCKSQYELTLDQNSEIHLVDDDGDIQSQTLDLVKIAALEQIEARRTVDIMGIIQEVGDVQSLTSKKSGQELLKADVTLMDDSGAQVRLTLWGDQAKDAAKDIHVNNVYAFRRCKVSDYNGKTLSGCSSIHPDPKIPETAALQQWWAANGAAAGAAVKSLSISTGGGKMESFAERKNIAAIKNQNLGENPEKPDYVSFKAHWIFFKKDKEGGAWYTACPNKEEPCRNRCKVTQTTDGNWQCARCQGVYPTCTRKWIFSGIAVDDSGQTWVRLFDDQALTLFDGVTADEANSRMDDHNFYDGVFAKATHTEWIMRCTVKQEIVNDEARVKTQVVGMVPVDYATECRNLISAIEKFGASAN